MAQKIPWQKWSIWYLWEHFLVPEHQLPIWVILKLSFCVEDIVEDMEIVNISLYVCISTNIDKHSHKSDSLDKLMRPSQNSMGIIAKC